MPNRYKITDEQLTEINAVRKKNSNKNIERRLLVLVLHAEGKSRSEIALRTGFFKKYISQLVSKYLKAGLSALIDNHYTGNHRNLSFSDEVELLAPFKEAANAGKIVDLNEIKKAYEARIGKSLEDDRSQIYRLLERHGWRKVMPRSKHPNKASDEVIETSKKLTHASKRVWKSTQKAQFG